MSEVAEVAAAADVQAPRSRGRTIAGALVSVLSIGGCVWWGSKQDAPTFPSGPGHIALFGLGVLVYAAATVVRGWRWDAILRYLRVRHERADAYALTVVGYMGNTVLPARGGELLRIFLLAERSNASRREVLGSIISERLLDVGALALLFVALTLSGAAEAPGGTITAYAAAGVVLGGVGAVLTYLRLRVAGRFERFATRIRPIARASRQLFSVRGALLFVVTVGVWTMEAMVFWLGAHALGIGLSVVDGLAVVVLSSFSAMIPAGPGYAGTYDAVALFALHRVGVSGGAAISCVLLFRFAAFVPVTIAGLVIMLTRYGGLRSALRRERADEARQSSDLGERASAGS